MNGDDNITSVIEGNKTNMLKCQH